MGFSRSEKTESSFQLNCANTLWAVVPSAAELLGAEVGFSCSIFQVWGLGFEEAELSHLCVF